ncbi:EpsG family protein [Bacteroides bouchesdurhonensis]|uniref:EpsG family protein n=1 Tax=Bacteroides bouchesdurhonensis TaxID=1841855 RepID=UPI0011DE24A2|nr:EpsG family protein [Bacteroides bouchesdurhonensis]
MEKAQLKVLLQTDWFIWLVFFICPVLAMPMVINRCYKQKKNAYILFALFMGLCAILLVPPTADLYRHWKIFGTISMMDKDEFFLYLSYNIKIDFLLYILEFIFTRYEISFGFVRFLLVFVASLLFLRLYDYFSNLEQKGSYDRLFVFGFVVLIIPFSAIATGLRFTFAAVIVSFYICKRYVFHKKSFFDFLLLILAVYFHFSILMIIMLIIMKMLNFYIPKKSFFYVIFGALLVISNSLNLLLSYLPLGDLGNYLVNYTEGKYSDTSYLSGFNIFFWLPVIFGYAVNVLFIILFCKKVPINKDTSIVYNLFLLYAFTISFFALNGRVQSFFFLYGIVFLIKYVGVLKVKRLFQIYLLYTVLAVFVGWRIHTITRWYYLFSPFPVALTMDYDDNWIYENIDSSGSPYIYNR